MIRSLSKNSFLPKQSSYGCDGIREGSLGFDIPFCPSYLDTMTPRMLSKNQADHAEQAQQTRGGTQYRLGDILSRRFKTPAGRKPTGNLPTTEARIGGVKVFVPMRTLNIVDKNPTNRQQALAPFVPMPGTAGKLDTTVRATIPTDRSFGELTMYHHFLGRWQFTSLDSWPTYSWFSFRRWSVEIGIAMKAADQRGMTSMAITEVRQLMRGVTPITQKHEFSLRKPVNQHRHQLTGQMRGCFMPVFFGVVKLLRTVQCHQYWQSPTLRGKRELYGDTQHDPAVSPAKDHMLVGRTHRVMMAALAVNTLTARTLPKGHSDQTAREKTRW